MSELITKFKYIKSGGKRKAGGYAEYIATREGVEKIDETFAMKPATERQQKIIARMTKDFPDSISYPEYADYQSSMTVGAASEFITRVMEDNSHEIAGVKAYANYIATRPRAERFGSHGLFTDAGVEVDLKKVSEEMSSYSGNIWTGIISLRREDAARLGFDNGARWRDMLRSQTAKMSECFKIPMDELRWYAAFHNEKHHPHVHLMIYSSGSSKPYLSKQGIDMFHSALIKSIFEQEMLFTYQEQTRQRDALKGRTKDIVSEIIDSIQNGSYDNPEIEKLLRELADHLSKTKGKKVYGYLKADVKAIVNRIVSELAKDERIAQLYDLWYRQKEKIIGKYTSRLPERVPLVDNEEFKSIKNTVIEEAMRLNEVRLSESEKDDDRSDSDKSDNTSGKETSSPSGNRSKKLSTNPEIALSAFRLLLDLGRLIEGSMTDDDVDDGHIDRKRRLEIREKKQALGQKME